MSVKEIKNLKRWSWAVALSLPVLAVQATLPAVLAPVADISTGVAQAQEEDQQERKTKRTQALNNKVYEKLQAAQEALEAKNYNEAYQVLGSLMNNDKKPLNDYEKANVLNLFAFGYYSQENYPKALDAYEQISNLPEAPEGLKTAALYSKAQLYFVTEQYQKAVDSLLRWFAVAPDVAKTSNAYVLLGQGYYQLKDYEKALFNVNKAISMYKEKGKVPKENWFGLQRFLYYEKNDYKKVVSILEELLTHYPKKQYWLQLSAMHAELKNEPKQLAAMETAYVQGMLSQEKELVNMAYLFLANEVPYKAAKVLDKGINAKIIEPSSKNLELLGNAWRAAQEVKKAIPEMAKAAAKSDQGELWARLGNIYLDNDDFDAAVKAINAGFKKGGVKRPDTANLVLGMAYFNLKQYDSARKAFDKAAKDKRSKTYAEQWIQYMDKELERQRSLEDV
jgi:tetratricopeptide (TPR) repeat protein